MSKILVFPNKIGDQEVKQKHIRSKKMFCVHKRTNLSETTRQLTCADCGSVIEPFDWINDRLKSDDRWWDEREALKREVADLRKKVDSLKKEERNAKNRIKRAKQKVDEAKVDEAKDKPIMSSKAISEAIQGSLLDD